MQKVNCDKHNHWFEGWETISIDHYDISETVVILRWQESDLIMTLLN